MTELKFRTDSMTEVEIKKRLNEIEPGLELKELVSPSMPGRRKSQGIEPFTYFVVVYGAHLAAGLTHDLIKSKILNRFKENNITEENTKPHTES